jgi:hypothetical protein
MKRFSIALLVLVLLSLRPGASAQVTYGTLMTVDEVKVTVAGFSVTGVVQGESAPSVKSISFVYGTETEKNAARENCARFLLLAMSRPGQYLLRVTEEGTCAVRLAAP